jgi:hypothetical protein
MTRAQSPTQFTEVHGDPLKAGVLYPAIEPKVCTECGGSGVLYSDNGPAPVEFECVDCGGSGKHEYDELEPIPLITAVAVGPNEQLWNLVKREQRGEPVSEELNALLAELEAQSAVDMRRDGE